jgi:hypothetical protein
MPNRIRKPRLDTVQNARRVVLESVTEPDKPHCEEDTGLDLPTVESSVVSQVMAAMGRKGGRIGGKRRLVTMTAKRRTQVAKLAAKARWTAVKKR